MSKGVEGMNGHESKNRQQCNLWGSKDVSQYGVAISFTARRNKRDSNGETQMFVVIFS